ncbi:MAG TPA: hypothetical protein VNU44_24275 [Bryobacteraceae bacterium]|jgi:hypothetical protein|nr:hypothetical protein [Bryobacteraceae bacterium]
MAILTSFFKGSDSTLGVFYPVHYIIAIFPTFVSAEAASQALRCAGLGEDEVLALPGAEVLRYFEEFRANSGYWAGIMSMLSRAFGTEQVFVDDDVHRAQAGEGFVAIYCPEEAQTSRIRELLTPFEPKAMHWYQAGGVQCLI